VIKKHQGGQQEYAKEYKAEIKERQIIPKPVLGRLGRGFLNIRKIHHLYKYDAYCLHEEVQPKHAMILRANTNSDKRAVMIITIDASITRRAMFGTDGLFDLANTAVVRRYPVSIVII
jgi:hypothetical protein